MVVAVEAAELTDASETGFFSVLVTFVSAAVVSLALLVLSLKNHSLGKLHYLL